MCVRESCIFRCERQNTVVLMVQMPLERPPLYHLPTYTLHPRSTHHPPTTTTAHPLHHHIHAHATLVFTTGALQSLADAPKVTGRGVVVMVMVMVVMVVWW